MNQFLKHILLTIAICIPIILSIITLIKVRQYSEPITSDDYQIVCSINNDCLLRLYDKWYIIDGIADPSVVIPDIYKITPIQDLIISEEDEL